MITIAMQRNGVVVGRLGENDAARIAFDVTDYVAHFPGAAYHVIRKRPNDPDAYPVPYGQVELDGNTLYWTLTSVDTAQLGNCFCQVTVRKDSTLAKSPVYVYRVTDTLDAEEEAPDEWQGWIDDLTDLMDQKIQEADDLLSGMITEAGTMLDGKISDAGELLDGKISAAEETLSGMITSAGETLDGKISDADTLLTGKISAAETMMDGKIADAAAEVAKAKTHADNAHDDAVAAAGSATAAAGSARDAAGSADEASASARQAAIIVATYGLLATQISGNKYKMAYGREEEE